MTQVPHDPPERPAPPDPGELAGSSVESTQLLRGRRELVIRHGAEIYRLKLTASNKLILTK